MKSLDRGRRRRDMPAAGGRRRLQEQRRVGDGDVEGAGRMEETCLIWLCQQDVSARLAQLLYLSLKLRRNVVLLMYRTR